MQLLISILTDSPIQKIFSNYFSKTFRFAALRCVLVMCGGEKQPAQICKKEGCGMMSPSDEKRIVAMVDSFTKTVARNFSRNLKRANPLTRSFGIPQWTM